MILKKVKVETPSMNLITNCYIVQDEETSETMVIDPGAEPEKIIEVLDILKPKLKYIFLTHCHADHISAVDAVKNKYGGKILISREDSVRII